MVIAKELPPPNWNQAQGIVGFPGIFGRSRIGVVGFGHENLDGGVWRCYRGKTGSVGYHRRNRTGNVNFRSNFYMQWAPRTANQNAAAANFRAGMAAWFALATEQKESYNLRARNLRIHGVNLFMREWMFSH
jgi:hypothetical protein